MSVETRRRVPEHISVIDCVVAEIRDKIVTGQLKDGDMLAPQGDMAHAMGVSRTSLREALNRLATMGLIETRQGTGTFVRTAKPVDFMRPLSSLLVMDKASQTELLDARMYIESALAALAAKNATDEIVSELGFLLQRMKMDFANGDLDGLSVHDLRFHLVVAESSGNRVLIRVIEVVRDLLHQFIRSYFKVHPTAAVEAIEYHARLHEAIRDRDATAARRHMEAHICSLMRATD